MQKTLPYILTGILVVGALLGTSIKAQLPAYYEPERLYQDALELFQKEKYGAAQEKFEEFLEERGFESSNHNNEINANAHYYQAVCAFYMDQYNFEPQMNQFIADFPENTKWVDAHYFLGKYYFDRSKYQTAIQPLTLINQRKSTDPDRDLESDFMLGYSYFMNNDYAAAQEYFRIISSTENPYTEDAAYYNSIILYQNGEYQLAYDEFEKLRGSKKYNDDILVYQANSMLKLKKYGELFQLADKLAANPKLKKADAQVYFIVANASYERDDFPKASNYFGQYVQKGGKLNRAGNYRYAYSEYKQKNYREAIPLFGKTLDQNLDSLTQIASYYLGFCYLKENDLPNARVAFEKAAKAPKPNNARIKEDAIYQYAKVCFSTKYYEESIKALRELERSYPTASYIPEVRSMIGELLFYSKNYQQAISYLESIPLTTTRAKKTYQTACFYYGTKLFDEGAYGQSEVYFQKAVTNSFDNEMALSAQYWNAEALFRQEKFDPAINAFNQFSRMPGSATHQYGAMASYGTAWCYFKQKKYTSALNGYEDFISKADRNTEVRYMVDAYLRAGDCQFLKRNYSEANDFYRKVADFNYTGVDYATYQMAEGEYRKGNYQKSVGTFAQLINSFKRSELRDNALDRISDIYATWIKDFSQSSKYARQLVTEYPKSPLAADGYNRLGLAAYFSNDTNGAINNFKKVLTDYTYDQKNCQIALDNLSTLLDPNDFDKVLKDYKKRNPKMNDGLADLTFNTGLDRFYGGDYRSAIDQLTSYINEYPGGSHIHEALIFRARSYQASGQTNNALSDYGRVYNTKPKNNFTNVALLEAAEIKFEGRNYASSLELFKLLEQTAEKLANQVEAKFGMAKCHQATGDYAQAKTVLQTIVADPSNPSATLHKAQMEIGICEYYLNQMDQALQTFRGVEKDNKTEYGARSQYMVTTILFEKGKFAEAKDAGIYLKNNYPSYNYWKAKAFLVVARCDYALGDNFQAKGVLDSIIANNQEFPEITKEAQELLQKIISEEPKN